MEQNKLILIGGGGHCKACIDVIESEGKYEIEGILDAPSKIGEKVLDYSIMGTDEMIESYALKGYSFLLTIGQIGRSELREKIYKQLKLIKANIATVIAKTAYVSRHATIGEGTILLHHVIVQAAASIGPNCIINDMALIEHDVVVGEHCHISTGAILNGGVQVGKGSFIGSGVVTKQYITIEPNSFVKANSLLK